jgi:hypothetical protein
MTFSCNVFQDREIEWLEADRLTTGMSWEGGFLGMGRRILGNRAVFRTGV